jgi:hypothetical protein
VFRIMIVIFLTEILYICLVIDLQSQSMNIMAEVYEDVKNAFGRNAEQILSLVILVLS